MHLNHINQFILNMKKLLLALLVLLFNKSFSQNKNFIDLPYIETNASADTLVTPNKISLIIILSEKDSKDKISVEELENLMEQKLISLGVDTKKNLSLNDFVSNFKKYFLKEKEILKTKSFTLVVQNAKLAGTVIAELEAIDISNIRISKTENTDYEKIKLLMKSKATYKAREQAIFMLKPLNQKVGNAIFITDTFNNSNRYKDGEGSLSEIVVSGYGVERKEKSKPIDIEFQKIQVESMVSVKFKIE